MTKLTTSGTALLGVLSVLGALSLVATSRADPGRFEFEAAVEIECGLRQAQLSVTDVDGDGIDNYLIPDDKIDAYLTARDNNNTWTDTERKSTDQ